MLHHIITLLPTLSLSLSVISFSSCKHHTHLTLSYTPPYYLPGTSWSDTSLIQSDLFYVGNMLHERDLGFEHRRTLKVCVAVTSNCLIYFTDALNSVVKIKKCILSITLMYTPLSSNTSTIPLTPVPLYIILWAISNFYSLPLHPVQILQIQHVYSGVLNHTLLSGSLRTIPTKMVVSLCTCSWVPWWVCCGGTLVTFTELWMQPHWNL